MSQTVLNTALSTSISTAMTTDLSRRSFLASTSAAAGGLMLSFQVPFSQAQDATPEVNAWVVIKPDDTVVVRMARAEMGQGTLTGLAQMVAEELESNWAKVTTEHPTPGQSLARKRVWGNFNATGSRGIRESQDYMRKGGAAARMMLVQAAAEAWGVPAAECVAANSVITHKASNRQTSYGKVAAAAAKLTPPDAASIEKRHGVKKVLQVGDSAVAVVADTWWRAKTALEALAIDWDMGPNAQVSSASMAEVLKAGLPPAKCDVYQEYLGGGFGRRARNDFVTQAVTIAKTMPGTPIKLIWSREEDMSHGFFHPITQCKLTAGLDDKGNVNALHMRISGQSILATVAPQAIRNGKDPVVFQGLEASGVEGNFGYTIPNLLIDHAMRNTHVPAGFWRGVNLNQNTIYVESFIDELAHATGQDPLAFRRKLMANHPKHLAVLNAVANKAGWDKPAPKGVFRRLAQTMGFGSYVAACAEVSVSDDGWLKIHRIVAATDPGHAVNVQQIEYQVEGSFVYGLSAALYGEITVSNGAVLQKNFDSYPVMRLHEMPKVETLVIPSGGFWGGVGEPTIAVAAPAVLNAIFAATGKRIRDLPLKHHSLKRA